MRTVGPQVDDPPHLVGGKGGKRLVVLGREQHDLGRARRGQAGDTGGFCGRKVEWVPGRVGRPAVREAAHVVGLGSLEAPDAERAAGLGQVGARLAVSDDVHPFAGERIEAKLAEVHQVEIAGMTSAAKRSSPSRSNGARIARMTYAAPAST